MQGFDKPKRKQKGQYGLRRHLHKGLRDGESVKMGL